MKLFITNSFSINMLEGSTSLNFQRTINPEGIINSHGRIVAAIGHEDLATIIEKTAIEGGWSIPFPLFNRVSISPDFESGDILLVCQYRGERLPEGATTLPEGSQIEFWVVSGTS